MRDRWRLIDAKGELAKNPRTKAAAFTISEAMAFLQDKPDADGTEPESVDPRLRVAFADGMQ
jgi:hypothetical protein